MTKEVTRSFLLKSLANDRETIPPSDAPTNEAGFPT